MNLAWSSFHPEQHSTLLIGSRPYAILLFSIEYIYLIAYKLIVKNNYNRQLYFGLGLKLLEPINLLTANILYVMINNHLQIVHIRITLRFVLDKIKNSLGPIWHWYCY